MLVPIQPEDMSLNSSADLEETSGHGPIKKLTDDILFKILHLAAPSFPSVYRLKAVCKRWQQIVDSLDWRYGYNQMEIRNSCTLKYQWCGIDGKRGQLKFFCPLEQKWFLPPPQVSQHSNLWTLVASEGGLLCYQNASKRSQLCVENPLKTPGFLFLPPIPHFDEEVTHGYGQTVRLIVKHGPDRLKIVLTVFPQNGDHAPALAGVTSTFSVVFDSTDMRWKVFRRSASKTYIWLSQTFLLGDIIFFRTIPKPFQKLTSLTLVRFHLVSGMWEEMTIDDIPCYAHKPLIFFQIEGCIYLLGSDCSCDYITVWRLECSVSQFLNGKISAFTVKSTMPRPYMDKLYVGRSYGHFSWKYFSFSQSEGICLVSERHKSQNWFTYNVTTRAWEQWNTPGKLPNKFHTWFSWEPRVFPLLITGVEL